MSLASDCISWFFPLNAHVCDGGGGSGGHGDDKVKDVVTTTTMMMMMVMRTHETSKARNSIS